MRVTELQSYSLLVNSIQRARAKAQLTQEQISTGKRVVKPSDDANAFDRIVATKSSMAKADQHARNLDIATNRLDLTDSALRSVTSVFGRVRELAVQFASNTNGASERVMGAQEVRQLFLQLQELGNVQNANGQAVFGGTSLHGRATGVAMTVPITLTSGTDDSLVVKVDGTTSGTISLGNATALTGLQLAALVQRKINTDATLSAAGKSVAVAFETDHLVITSDNSGQTSSVEVTGGTGLRGLGFNGGSTTTGASAFALRAATSVSARNAGSAVISQGTVSNPNAVTLNDYVVKFSAATTFDVYNVSTAVTVAPNSTNSGGAVKGDSGVVDTSRVTLDSYEVRMKNIYTVTAANKGLQFDPGTGAAVTAQLTTGTYTGAQLATEIKVAMELAEPGAKTYTVGFSETTGKFSITNDAANAATLSLLPTNVLSTAKSLLGLTGPDQANIAAGGTATSDVDTTGAAGVSKQHNVYDTTTSKSIFNLTSANNTIYRGGTAITLATGSYTGSDLAAEIQSKLGSSYTVAYNTAGTKPERKFTITNSTGGPVTFNWSNAGATAASLLGYEATDSVVANAGTDVSDFDAGNTTYLSGANIDFDGLRVVLQDGGSGPRNGDVFTVAQTRKIVLSNQSYVSGGAIDAEGLRFSLRDGASAPASGDLFRVQTGVQYQGDDGLQTIEIADGQTVKTNKPGNQTFTGSTIDIFASVKSLTAALNGNYGGGIQQGLAGVDVAVDQVSSVQGELGALSNRLGATKASLDETKAFLSNLLSSNEDVDLVSAISSLTLQQQAIEAAGATLNRIFQSSLLNFLK